jgi:hypothetical protein
VLQGDPHTGKVGTVESIFTDDDGDLVHVVRFCADRDNYPHHTAYYLTDELLSAEVGSSANGPQSRSTQEG